MISKLHYITQDMINKTHQEQAIDACEGGVDWVQLRLKNKSEEEMSSIAGEVQIICKKNNAVFIINDHVELAAILGADGVHLGKDDMDPVQARNFLGEDFIIGASANTWDDVERLLEAKVDYIGIGPFKFTLTKEKLSPLLGIEGYKRIVKNCEELKSTVPLIAIGGIGLQDVVPLLQTGCYGVAVARAINLDENPGKAAKRFRDEIYNCIKN